MMLKLNNIKANRISCTSGQPLFKAKEERIMRTVPSNLNYRGYIYTQVCRGTRSCLYRQTLHGKTIGFEVFVITILPETIINGIVYPQREKWPQDKDFGKTAWACMTLDRALERYRMLEGDIGD